MTSADFNRLYHSFGYRKFKMSKFEPYDLYVDYRDFLTSREVITFNDLDGTLLALKPDVTLSIIKNNTGEEKVYYNENVYRARNHHYREIQQVGVECVGKIDVMNEAEVLAMAAKSLALISDRYVLRISDIGFLQQLLADLGLSGSTAKEVAVLFGSRSIAGLGDLVREGKISGAAEHTLAGLMQLYLPIRAGIAKIRELPVSGAAEAADHLTAIADVLGAYGVLDSIYLDFSIVNSMDYYNGLVFQGAVPEIPYGILFGGRYDRLPEKMGKCAGAIGFAVYLDEIDNYITPPVAYDVDVLLLYGEDPAEEIRAAKIAGMLIAAGKTVRTVRKDMADGMQQKPRSRRTAEVSKLAGGTAEELLAELETEDKL